VALFKVTQNLKHRAILMTIYAAGLRVSELTNLQVTDIDSQHQLICIRQDRGSKGSPGDALTNAARVAPNLLEKLPAHRLALSGFKCISISGVRLVWTERHRPDVLQTGRADYFASCRAPGGRATNQAELITDIRPARSEKVRM
jgi:integrase